MKDVEAPPSADPAGEGPWSLVVWPEENNSAYLSSLPMHGNDAVRVAITKVAGQDPWEIQLLQTGPVSRAGRSAVLRFRGRADVPRAIGIGFSRAREPWTDLGLYRELQLTTEWQSFHEHFVMTAEERETQIVFNVGMDTTPVELARVGLTTSGDTPAPALSRHSGEKAEGVGTPAGILNRPIRAARARSLKGVSSEVLTAEILARIEEGAFTADEASVLLGTEIQSALRAVMDVTRNRWSRQRYREQFYSFRALPRPWPTIQEATVVDLGCGALNPYGVAFLFLLLGARRGIAIDLDEILDLPRAVRALADLAAMMLIDPTGIVADFPVTRAEMLRNIASFDLPSLERGEVEGIDPDRLTYARESVNALPLPSGEADFVFSNAMLEHLDLPEEAIAEMARVTRPGGVGVHIVDASDHRSYADPAHHPLTFLTEPSVTPLLHGSNRIRPREFLPIFESHGFEVLSFEPFRHVDLTGDMLKQLAHPWRRMSPEALGELDGRICVRRRP